MDYLLFIKLVVVSKVVGYVNVVRSEFSIVIMVFCFINVNVMFIVSSIIIIVKNFFYIRCSISNVI